MKKAIAMASAMMALALIGNMTSPDAAAAREAYVCQFYSGDPLCKTVEEESCIGVDVGVEGRTCRKTTEFWYWS